VCHAVDIAFIHTEAQQQGTHHLAARCPVWRAILVHWNDVGSGTSGTHVLPQRSAVYRAPHAARDWAEPRPHGLIPGSQLLSGLSQELTRRPQSGFRLASSRVRCPRARLQAL